MTFKKFTTAYDDIQDRFRISGEVEGARVLTLWLTARLLQRLVLTLAKLISPETTVHTREGSVQAWQQASAKAVHAAQPQKGTEDPAPAAHLGGNHTMRLIHSVDLEATAKQVVLIFRVGNNAEVARLPLSALELRQWLGILHRKCVRCGWSTEGWPAWLAQTDQPVQNPNTEGAVFH
mgnify:CR=1 FL=1